jgi:uncharacterized protein YdhG (YjbR/CyaY superfamily)
MRNGVVVRSVDEYIELIEEAEAREAITRIRNIIRSELPEADEVMSYGMPMVKLHGMVAGFAAFKNHCSFFPGHTVADFTEELKDFKTSKGTVQFQPKMPIPENLIRAMVRARANENATIAKEKGKK